MKPPHRKRKMLRFQALEQRQLLAGDLLHNFVEGADVNLDAEVNVQDAVKVLERIQQRLNNESIGRTPSPPATDFLADVDNDGTLDTSDLLQIINRIPETASTDLNAGASQLATQILTETLPEGMLPAVGHSWLENIQARISSQPAGPFLQLDANDDGLIIDSEVADELWQVLSSVDLNGDMSVTEEEAKIARLAELLVQRPADAAIESLVYLDLDGDGALSEFEVSARAWMHVSPADSNGDGDVTLEEMASARESNQISLRLPSPEQAFALLDVNDDDRVSPDEVTEALSFLFLAADFDMDGTLSIEELNQLRQENELNVQLLRGEEAFELLDVNEDGQLDATELSAAAFEVLSFADGNGDGSITQIEIRDSRLQAELQLRLPNPDDAFARLDSDVDGNLTDDEVSETTFNLISRADTDSSQSVSLAELNSQRQQDEFDVRGPAPAMAFDFLDVIADGRLSQAEVTLATWQLIASADADSDDHVSENELLTERADNEQGLRLPQFSSAFAALDLDENDLITQSEVSSQTWDMISRSDLDSNDTISENELSQTRADDERVLRSPDPQSAITFLDVDQDNAVARAEVSDATWQRLMHADANDDQQLTLMELSDARRTDEFSLNLPSFAAAYERLDDDQNAALSEKELTESTFDTLSRIDVNNDGNITAEEIQQTRDADEQVFRGPDPQAGFTALDVNQDSVVSRSEVTDSTWLRVMHADANEDEAVTLQELSEARAADETQLRFPSFAPAFDRLDDSQNGVLSEDEVTDSTYNSLQRVDVNGDGEISISEIDQTRQIDERAVRGPDPTIAFDFLDASGDGFLARTELTEATWQRLMHADTDVDDALTLSELSAARSSNETQLRLPNFAAAFSLLDDNSDGRLDQDELTSQTWILLARADADSSLDVTVAELNTQRAADELDLRGPNPQTAASALDADSDEAISESELTNETWQQVQRADANQDNAVTVEELLQTRSSDESALDGASESASQEAFGHLDLNEDDLLTQDELTAETFSRLEVLDTNNDDALSTEEIASFFAAPELGPIALTFDTTGNGPSPENTGVTIVVGETVTVDIYLMGIGNDMRLEDFGLLGFGVLADYNLGFGDVIDSEINGGNNFGNFQLNDRSIPGQIRFSGASTSLVLPVSAGGNNYIRLASFTFQATSAGQTVFSFGDLNPDPTFADISLGDENFTIIDGDVFLVNGQPREITFTIDAVAS